MDLDSAGITRQGARKSVRLSGSSQVASEMDARSDGKRALRSFRSPQSILKNCESEIVSVADIDAVVTREFTKSSDSQTEVKPQSERSMVILRKATLFSRFFSALMCGKPNDSESDFPASPHFPASPPQSECQPLSSSGSRASLSNCRINSNSRRQSSARPSETSEKTEHSEGVASEASSVTTQHTAGGSSSRGRAARSRTVSMAINVSRLLSRWMDDGAPWNTGAQHFKNMDTLAIEPRPEELEDIQRHSASSTRKRFMEYMIRRGGHTEATRQSLAMENMPKNLGSPACAAKQFLPQGQATVSELGSEVVASVKMMGSCHRDRQSRQTD